MLSEHPIGAFVYMVRCSMWAPTALILIPIAKKRGLIEDVPLSWSGQNTLDEGLRTPNKGLVSC